jgi:hypothetical protein
VVDGPEKAENSMSKGSGWGSVAEKWGQKHKTGQVLNRKCTGVFSYKEATNLVKKKPNGRRTAARTSANHGQLTVMHL